MTVPLAAPPRNMITAPTRRRGTGSVRVRSAAVQRAYARRAQRTGALRPACQSPGQESVATLSRTPFVVLVMVLLSVTLVATLWLSTAAAADSYRLQSAREATRDLTERSEQLGREVATLETAPELARRAAQLGLVPAGDPARLMV
ncbi:MAG: septum formation initiator, partial [Pseudonocardiaceae bacterium]